MNNIAIIIPCYKRTDTLRVLLDSLLKAKYDRSVDLIFSIDFSGNNDVSDLAKEFKWPFGKKEVIRHTENVGLRRNIISCGDMTVKYDGVIILEDDLIVSPYFMQYATKTAEFYENDDRIAGISLYSYGCTENVHEFTPITDGYDTYFMQWTSSWGQLWTRKQWSLFKEWYLQCNEDLDDYKIPNAVKKWKQSWKKFNIAYITDTNKFYVYPAKSFTTMVPAQGTHKNNVIRSPFIVPLCTVLRRDFVFQPFDGALKYDCFFELYQYKINIDGKYIDVDFDIYCDKYSQDFRNDYYITSKFLGGIEPVKQWGLKVLPLERNVIDNFPGNGLYLYKIENFVKLQLTPEEKRDLKVYMGTKEWVKYAISKIIGSFFTTLKIR